LRLGRGPDPTDEQIASLGDDELAAWAEANAIGPWEPNASAGSPEPAEAITLRVPADLLIELRIEASLRRQPWPRYARDLLLFAVRHVQAARARPAASSEPGPGLAE
jgi:hypothetical protein